MPLGVHKTGSSTAVVVLVDGAAAFGAGAGRRDERHWRAGDWSSTLVVGSTLVGWAIWRIVAPQVAGATFAHMADHRHVLAGIRLMVIPLAAVGIYLLVRSAVQGAIGVALALALATVVSLLLYKKVQRDRG